MPYISHSGYGYSKLLCENVTSWFLNKFLPRHKIDVEILHRGLRREGVYGYCDFVDEAHRPRHFLIELNTHMDKELYTKTLLRVGASSPMGCRFTATPSRKNVLL
jgi:hypothetical protein